MAEAAGTWDGPGPTQPGGHTCGLPTTPKLLPFQTHPQGGLGAPPAPLPTQPGQQGQRRQVSEPPGQRTHGSPWDARCCALLAWEPQGRDRARLGLVHASLLANLTGVGREDMGAEATQAPRWRPALTSEFLAGSHLTSDLWLSRPNRHPRRLALVRNSLRAGTPEPRTAKGPGGPGAPEATAHHRPALAVGWP